MVYESGKAVNKASDMEIDSVIDLADTRKWISRGLKSVPPKTGNETNLHFVDSW